MRSRSQYIQLVLVVCVVAVAVAVLRAQRLSRSATSTSSPIEALRTPNLVGATTREEKIYRSADLEDLTQEAADQPGFAQASHLIFERVPDETLRRGEVLAKAHCTSYHGANLEDGDGVKIRLAGETYRRCGLRYNMGYKYGSHGLAVYRSIKYGTRNELMPAFEGVLSEPEILAVAHYIRSTQCNTPETLKNR